MAEKVNLVIDQGATFLAQFEVYDENESLLNFTTYTLESQLRKNYSSSNGYSFTVSGSNNGIITLAMSAQTTETLLAGRYVYDIQIEDNSGFKNRIVEGIVTVTPQVTR